MSKLEFEPKTLAKLIYTCVISSKHYWVFIKHLNLVHHFKMVEAYASLYGCPRVIFFVCFVGACFFMTLCVTPSLII